MSDEHRELCRRESVVINRFEFRGFHGCRCHCTLEVIPLGDGRTVVIAIELEDNPGTSITNVAEHLASYVCDQFEIDSDKLVWIEHYAYGSASPALAERTFDLVTFERSKPYPVSWSVAVLKAHPDGWPGYFAEPEWQPMTDADWLALGLTPRQPVQYPRSRK